MGRYGGAFGRRAGEPLDRGAPGLSLIHIFNVAVNEFSCVGPSPSKRDAAPAVQQSAPDDRGGAGQAGADADGEEPALSLDIAPDQAEATPVSYTHLAMSFTVPYHLDPLDYERKAFGPFTSRELKYGGIGIVLAAVVGGALWFAPLSVPELFRVMPAIAVAFPFFYVANTKAPPGYESPEEYMSCLLYTSRCV